MATAYSTGFGDPAYYEGIANSYPSIASQYQAEAQQMGLSTDDYYQYLAAKNTPNSSAAQVMAASLQQQGMLALIKAQGQTQGGGGTTGGGGTQSYLSGAGGAGGTTVGAGGTTNAVGNVMANTTASGIATGTNVWGGAAAPANIAEWQKWYGANVGNTILVNGQPMTIGSDINPDQLYQAFQQNQVGFGSYQAPGPQQPAGQIGATQQPETAALAQMAQIDPTTEALRNQVAQSYLTNLQNPPTITGSTSAAAPSTADVQSYLNLYQQIDPTSYAATQQLGSDLAAQEALGSQLDPETAREVTQATLQAQTQRGNVYGTPQLVQQAMTTGQAGLALQQQRQQALQGYLTSGATLGDIANNLYNQGYSRYLGAQAQQYNEQMGGLSAALGYLGSGSTPLQAATGYINQAQQNAAAAAQGGPVYNPQALGQSYTGTGASSYPQYGLDVSQLAGNYYNNMNSANLQAYGLQQAYGNQQSAMGGLTSIGGSALSGAASGALAGSAIPGVGTLIGGAVGALGGAAMGAAKYYG